VEQGTNGEAGKLSPEDFAPLFKFFNNEETKHQALLNFTTFFKQIIDATYFNKDHLESWSSPLPKIGGPVGTYYTNLDKLYARGRVYAGVVPHDFDLPSYATDADVNAKCDETKTIFYSPWSEVAIGTQTFQEVLITEEGEEDIKTDSDKIGMHFNAKP